MIDRRYATEKAEKYEAGWAYQDFVAREFCYRLGIPLVSFQSLDGQLSYGENLAGVEIKLDRRMADTGNVYIETAERGDASSGDYVPSGIFRDKSWLYAIGDYKTLYVLGVKRLRRLYQEDRFERREIETSRGFLLPVADAALEAELVLHFQNGGNHGTPR